MICCDSRVSHSTAEAWVRQLVDHHPSLWDGWNPTDPLECEALAHLPGWWPLIDAALTVLGASGGARVGRIKEKLGSLRIQLLSPNEFQRGVVELAREHSHHICPGCGGAFDTGTVVIEQELETEMIDLAIQAGPGGADGYGSAFDVVQAFADLGGRVAEAHWASKRYARHYHVLKRAHDRLRSIELSRLVWRGDDGIGEVRRGQCCRQVSHAVPSLPPVAHWWEDFLWAVTENANDIAGLWIFTAPLGSSGVDPGRGVLLVGDPRACSVLDELLVLSVGDQSYLSNTIVREPSVWVPVAHIHDGFVWTPVSDSDCAGPWIPWPLQGRKRGAF